MALASAAAAAGDQSNIDLRPYGFNLTLTTELPNIDFLQALRDGQKNARYVVSDSNPNVLVFISREDTIKYTKIQEKNSGNFGEVSIYTDPSGKKVAIKKIRFDPSNLYTQTHNFLRECIIQIILAETSRQYNQVNFGVPELYKLGISMDRYKGFIVSELMEDTLFKLLLTKDDEEVDSIVPDMLLQVADILDFFQKTLRFNHRDLKRDNIMYKMVDGHPIYKLIDFGYSCITWNQLSIETTTYPFTSCFREGRDLSQLLYDFLLHNAVSSRLEAWIVRQRLAPLGTGWFNSYKLFNTQNKRQGYPQKMTPRIQAFQELQRSAAAASAAAAPPAAPAPPAPPPASAAPATATPPVVRAPRRVKARAANASGSRSDSNSLGSLALSPTSSLGPFGPLEIELALRSPAMPLSSPRVNVQRPVAAARRQATPAQAAFANLFPQFAIGAPAAAVAVAKDKNEPQIGLPGILGGYKRKQKRKQTQKTRKLRKRKATRKVYSH